MNSSTQISRRTVLRGLGTAMGLPLLQAMCPTTVRGEGNRSKPPLRTAFLYVPNGVHMPDWTPSEPAGELADLPPILQPLAEHTRDLLVLSGLTLNGARALGDGGGDHARSVAAFLTGAHPVKTSGANIKNGISVDQVAAAKVGDQTRFPSLELGCEPSRRAGRCDSGYSCVYTSNISWRTPTAPMSKEVDPRAVFDRLFGNGDQQRQRKSLAAQAQRRKSILDFVADDARRLHNRLGASDRRKLDEYLHAVREIEQRVVASAKPGERLEIPSADRPDGIPGQFGDHVRLMMDLMVLAMQTDSTRILTFMYANAGSNRTYKNIGVSQGHHSLSHHQGNKEKQAKISKINQYHASLLAHLLDRMKAIPEGDGCLLDHAMVMYGSGISDGNRHGHHDLPIVLAGRGGGSLRSGRHIRYEQETPLTNLYLAMLERIGAPTASLADSTGVLQDLA